MDIKDTKDFAEKLDRDWDDNPTKYVRPYIPEMVIQDRTKLIEELIQWHKERYSKNILNEKQHGQAYWNAENENDGWNNATQDTIRALSKLKEQRDLIGKE